MKIKIKIFFVSLLIIWCFLNIYDIYQSLKFGGDFLYAFVLTFIPFVLVPCIILFFLSISLKKNAFGWKKNLGIVGIFTVIITFIVNVSAFILHFRDFGYWR
jgi:hypothetical protein